MVRQTIKLLRNSVILTEKTNRLRMVKNFDVEEDEGLYFFRFEDFCEMKEKIVR